MKLFALRHKKTKEFMTVCVSSNGDAEFCNSCTVRLMEAWLNNGHIWTTTSLLVAETVANNDEDWYNSSVDSPQNQFVGELEVVEFEMKD